MAVGFAGGGQKIASSVSRIVSHVSSDVLLPVVGLSEIRRAVSAG